MGIGTRFLTIAGASPSTQKIKGEEEMGLIKKVQLEEAVPMITSQNGLSEEVIEPPLARIIENRIILHFSDMI